MTTAECIDYKANTLTSAGCLLQSPVTGINEEKFTTAASGLPHCLHLC